MWVNEQAIKNGTRQLFYQNKNDAIKNLGAGGLNKIVSLDNTLEGMFKKLDMEIHRGGTRDSINSTQRDIT